MNDNKDYQAGYRGDQFHHGMDRATYDAGKAAKENLDAIGRMAGGGEKTEIPGVAFTLILIAPMIWMVYPALGMTIWAAVAACYLLLIHVLNMPSHWAVLLGFILCVMSFVPGMVLEQKASQAPLYRGFRALVRIGAPLIFFVIGVSGRGPSDMQIVIKDTEPGAIGAWLCIAVIAYFIYQRLDLLYFPARDKIRKLQEKINKGERPTRSMGKRMAYGLCWFVPVMVVLTVIYYIVIRCTVESPSEQITVSKKYGPIVGPINAAVWYLLCLLGVLPGTGKYMFSKTREERLMQIET